MNDWRDSQGHVIDADLYLDSGGGSMCANCGRQGIDLAGPCEFDHDPEHHDIGGEG